MSNKFNTRMQQKIDTYENWSKATNFIPLKGELIIYTTDENDEDKIGLKIGNGQDNVNILPFVEIAAAGGAGGGTTTPQIQSDWLQENSSKKDYIKNKPFYALPAEHNFDLGLNRTFEEYIWDGDITNRPGFNIEFQGTKVSWYKVSDTFYSYEDVLNGYAYISAIPEDEFKEMQEEGVQSYLIPIPLTEDVLNNMLLYADSHYLIGMGAVSTDTPGVLSLPDGNGGTVDFDIPEPGTYYTYDETGDLFGEIGSYTKQIVGPVDILNDPSFMIAPDIYGTGTYLAFKKVSNLYFDQSSLLNTFFTMNMISYDPSEMFDGMCVQQKVSKEMLNNMNAITSSTDNSYALTADGIPLFASFETDVGEINGMTPGKGTYLMYSDIGSANGGMVLYLDNFNSGETIFQIDPKFIPEQKTITPDYSEMDPESKKYIANRPYYNYNYYNYFYGDVSDTSLRVNPNNDNTKFYQWGCSTDIKNPRAYNKGDVDIKCDYIYYNIKGTINGPSYGYDSNTNKAIWFYNTSWDSDLGKYIYTIYAYLILEDNLSAYVMNPWADGNYERITFPKAGIYYLYDESDPDNIDYVCQIDLRRQRNNLPSSPTPIDYVSSGSASPITSRAVYKALGNSTTIPSTSTVTNGSNKLITSGGVYNALQNIGGGQSTLNGYIVPKELFQSTGVGDAHFIIMDYYKAMLYQIFLQQEISADMFEYKQITEDEFIITLNFLANNNLKDITDDRAILALANNITISNGSPYSCNSTTFIELSTKNLQYPNSYTLRCIKNPNKSNYYIGIPVDGIIQEFDQNSTFPVSSEAVYDYIQNLDIQADSYLSTTSTRPVQNKVITEALNNINESIVTDDALDPNSTNPIQNRAVYTALQEAQISNADTVDGYHFQVSNFPPVEGEVDDYTITFVI